MLFKTLMGLAVAASASLVFSSTADASPRFTVHNNTKASLKVIIFNGDDSYCDLEEKVKTVSEGKSGTYGCSGNGKGRCKIRLKLKGDEICKSDQNTCGGDGTKIDNGGEVRVSQTDTQISCKFTN